MFRRLRWKLLATYIVVVVAALVFVGVHLTQQFERIHVEQLKVDLLDMARVMALSASEGLAAGDSAAIRRYLQGAHHGAEGPTMFATDTAGIVIAGRGMADSVIGSKAEDPSISEALQGREVTGVGAAPGRAVAVYAAVPVHVGDRVLGAVHVARSLSYLNIQLQHIRLVVASATVVALLIAAGLGGLLAGSIAGFVQEVQRVASHLAAGRLSERVPVRTQDELGDLARSLNYMAGELERVDSLRRHFVADASHELRTPVANLAVGVEALKAVIRKDPDQAEAVVEDLEREAQRLRRLAEDLLDLSLVESGQVRLNLTPVQVAELVQRAVQPFHLRADQTGIALRTELPSQLPPVRADAERTIQALTNLLDNAFRHTPKGGAVTVSGQERRGHILISTEDTGQGIPAAELPHIFDRFYKVDKARTGPRGGAGLGLAIAKRLVEAQGGIIMAESKEGHGARFVIALPEAGLR